MANVYGAHMPMQIRMELDILSQVGVPLALAVSLSGASPVPLLHTLPTHPPPTRRPRRSSGCPGSPLAASASRRSSAATR